MNKIIPSIKVPIIQKGIVSKVILCDELKDKKIIMFGVPGAFTPTCSEKHMPSYIKLHNEFIAKGIDDIYCLSVNDEFVMQAWLLSYTEGDKILGIADGNGEVSKNLNLLVDKSANFMGMRCSRFAMIVQDNNIHFSLRNISELIKKDRIDVILAGFHYKDFLDIMFNRFYFAVTTGCLIGYGDIYPITNTSKTLAIIQSLLTVGLILA